MTSIDFPADDQGRRSTSAFGKAVVADALRQVDPTGAVAAQREPNWRGGYVAHMRRLVEAGLSSPEDWRTIARSGLDSIHSRLVVGDQPLAEWSASSEPPKTAVIKGEAEPLEELVIPYRGQRLKGAELHAQLESWQKAGVLEPGVIDAVLTVAANPEWLRADGRTIVAVGAGSEMGPFTSLLRWGAQVAAVDLPRPDMWDRLAGVAAERAGTMIVPTATGDVKDAGVDVTSAVPELTEWLAGLEGQLVLGNYVYADGAANVRVCAAVDALTIGLLRQRPDTALGFLATPTDVFAVPGDAVDFSVAAFAARSKVSKALTRPLRAVSGNRLLTRQYTPGIDPGLNDSLVSQQGPNYALAKRLQRWRATVARTEGTTVSLNVAPPTRTRSVVKNRALAAAYAGAHRFGVEVFEPATSNVLMAALLIHDLHVPMPAHEHPWQDEAAHAVHGGLWRTGYAPRSALGLAALLGLGASRA